MTRVSALAELTLRALAGRRRLLLMIALAALPAIVAIILRLAGGRADAPEIIDALVIRTVLPLVALVIGTAAIGSEIDDGTAVFLLVKPIPRWLTALVKILVAAALTLLLVVPPVLLTGPLVAGFDGANLGTTAGYALATAAGAIAYVSGFVALGAITSRALLVGLGYVLLWEGALAGILEGTRYFSVRQATLGLAAGLTGESRGDDVLEPGISVVILVVVTLAGFLLTARALQRFQVRAGD
jgi:ABC-2 type transport system permease protein